MALVRRDPVAAALVAQAARHAEGLPPAPAVAAAARLARAVDTTGAPEQAAARKVVQALVRSAVIEAEGGAAAMTAATRRRLAAMLHDEPLDLAEANLLISTEASAGPRHPRAWGGSTGGARGGARRGAGAAGGGFRGDAADYDDPRNSFLDQCSSAVTNADRPGHPHARGRPARRCPHGGHRDARPLRGRRARAGASPEIPRPVRPLGAALGRRPGRDRAPHQRVEMRPEFLAPADDRAILARTLANLRGSYLRRRRPRDALWTVRAGSAPGAGRHAGLESRAIGLLAGTGRYAEAGGRARS